MFDFEGAQVVQGGLEGSRLWAQLGLGLGLVHSCLLEHAE